MSAGTQQSSLKTYLALPANHALCVSFFLSLIVSFGLFSQTPAFSIETPAQSFLNKNPEGAVARLSDSEVRRLLLKRLVKEESEPKETFNPAITAWRLQRHFGTIQKEMRLLVNAAPDLPGVFPRALDALNKDRGEGGLGRFILSFLSVLILGAMVEFMLRQKLKDQIQKVSARAPKELGAQASALGFLFILDTLMILVFLSTRRRCFSHNICLLHVCRCHDTRGNCRGKGVLSPCPSQFTYPLIF
jgi:hypothetical protein